MASTFFASLTPGDGPNNYAGFMTRMSATLERIARIAVEKDEKRSRAPDEEDTEYKPPGAKRHSSRTQTAQHPRQHRQPTTLRTSMTPNTAPNQSTPSTAQVHRTDTSIPDTLEGLLPVNSSGYVVPLSPRASTQPQNPYSTNPPSNYSPSTNTEHTYLPESTGNVYPSSQIPSWQLSQDFQTTVAQTQAAGSSALNPTNTNSPDSFSSADNVTPEFFQMPVSGSWQYGGNLFAGFLPTEYNSMSSYQEGSQSANAYSSMPVLSAESFIHGAPAIEGYTAQNGRFDPQSLGYGYMPQGPEDPSQGADPVWPNGFLGLF